MTTAAVLDVLKTIAIRYGSMRLRETAYSHLIFAELRAQLGDQFLTSVGIYKEHLVEGLADVPAGDKTTLDTVLRKSDDLYPDLTVFPTDLRNLGLVQLDRFNLLNAETAPTHLFEWKCTNTFPSMARMHLLKDAAKLELIRLYLGRRYGRFPEIVQVVFFFPRQDLRLKPDTFKSWFAHDDWKTCAPNLSALLMDHEGTVTVMREAKNAPTSGATDRIT